MPQIIHVSTAESLREFSRRIANALEEGYEPLFPATIAITHKQDGYMSEAYSVFMKMPNELWQKKQQEELTNPDG